MPSRADRCIETIKTQCRILTQEKIPFIFSSKPARNVVSFGTKFSLEKFQEHENTFKIAFNDDIKKMCDPEDDDEDVHHTHGADDLEKMKTPLSLANHDEIKKYGRYLILKDHMQRFPTSLERNIKYGHAEWEASFWPNDMLNWRDITKNFSNIRINDFPGKTSILDVLREAIKRGLTSKGINPENHYDPSLFGKDEENKRKRNRGIHVPQERVQERLVDYDDSAEQSDSSNSSTFQPRRPNLRILRDTSSSSSEPDPYETSNVEAQEEQINAGLSETSPTNAPERPHLINRLLPPSRLGAVDPDDPLEVDAFIASVRTSLFPGEIDDNDNGEEQEQHAGQHEEQYQRHEEPEQASRQSNSSDYTPHNDQQNCPYSGNASSSSSSPNYTSPSCHSSSSNSFNVTGRPQRLRKRKVIFDNSEPTKTKRRKTALTESIERLIRPPTENQKRKEREEQEKQEQRRLRQEAHRKEMEQLDEAAEQFRRRRDRENEISKELQIQANHLRENLSEKDIRIMFKNNLRYFKKIETGLEQSWRHKM